MNLLLTTRLAALGLLAIAGLSLTVVHGRAPRMEAAVAIPEFFSKCLTLPACQTKLCNDQPLGGCSSAMEVTQQGASPKECSFTGNILEFCLPNTQNVPLSCALYTASCLTVTMVDKDGNEFQECKTAVADPLNPHHLIGLTAASAQGCE